MGCFENEGIINTDEFKEAFDIVLSYDLSLYSLDFLYRSIVEFEEENAEWFFDALIWTLVKLKRT